MTRHSGFSITELIVVLAIAALLIGVLLPAAAGVRHAARGAACVSNLRQMTVAAQRYALEYGAWPPAVRHEIDGGVITVAWDWVTRDGPEPELIAPGTLWSFSDDPGAVQQCPAYHGTTNFADPYTGYNYNTTYVGGWSPWPHGWEQFNPGLRYSAARRPAQAAVFGDGGRRGGTNKFMRAPLGREALGLDVVYSGGQAFRHQRMTNVAYLDGHVAAAATPRPGNLATEALLSGTMGYPDNGFLSDDDRAYDPD